MTVLTSRSCQTLRRRLAPLVLVVCCALSAAAQTLPSLTATPATVSFSYTIGAAQLPAAQSLRVQRTGSGEALSFTVSVSPAAAWLIVTPLAGATGSSLSVRVNPTSLDAAAYTTNIVLTSAGAGNSPLNVPVTLTVVKPRPTMAATPSSVTFNFVTDQGAPPAAQTLSIGTDGEPIAYSASIVGARWLSLTPTDGISVLGNPAALTLTVDPSGLVPGSYTGSIRIASTTAANRTLTVGVTLLITAGTAVLSSAWPPDAAVGSNDLTVTLRGLHLFPTSVVTIGATTLTMTWISTEVLLVVIPATLLASQGNLSITVTNAPQPASNALTLTVHPPGPRIRSVANAASFLTASPTPVISPGEIIAIFGSGLGPQTMEIATPAGGAYPTTLGNVTVEFEVTTGNWVAAPIIFAQASQLNVVAPFNMTPASGMKLRVTYNAVQSSPCTFNGANTNPGVFTIDSIGVGQAAVLNYNATTGAYSVNSRSNMAARGSTIVIYATGGGQTSPLPTPEGKVIPTSGSPPLLTNSTTVTIGGETVPATFAGSVPGSIAGLVQINAVIPDNAPTGQTIAVLITIGGVTSQPGVTIGIKK